MMKTKALLLYIASTLMLVGCINNDVPYPHIRGEITAFEVEGQKEILINNETRTITLVMDENTDIRTTKITKFSINDPDNNATYTIDPTKPIDLTGTYDFKIHIYRDWDWKIETSQPIERKIIAKGQVGAAQIDYEAKTAHFSVSDINGVGNLTMREVKLGPPSAKYTPDPITIRNFSEPVSISVEFWGKTETWTLTADNTTEVVFTLEPGEVWGGFAIVNGSIVEGTESEPTFQYRKKGTEEWLNIKAEIVDGAAIKARITGLEGETTYEYRAEMAKEYGEIMEFTTEATPLIPNMGLEEWAMASDNKTWYPNLTAAYTFWASGNQGVTSTMAGKKDSNVTPTDDSKSGKAACLQTINTSVGAAAGSLFTGRFKVSIPTTNSAKFTQDYTGRPTRISVWYKYEPKIIDSAPTAHKDSLGMMDKCNIAVYLGTWTKDVLSKDLKGELTVGAVAYAEFISDETVGEYKKLTLDLKYLDRETIPTKIIILSSSSKYGDLFVGGIGSKLYLDEFEFEFD